MLNKQRFSLNRIACPNFSMSEFFKFTRSIGLSKVELRNDLPGKMSVEGVVDGLKPAEVQKMANEEGIEIITINALQKFNLASVRDNALSDLEQLLSLSAEIKCKSLILCPNNDISDFRTPAQRYIETVEALRQYGQLFVQYGIAGFLEPLGFGISSLASLPIAMHAVKESGFSCFKVVHDTFHHHIGPDDIGIFGADGFGASYETVYTGLVHISGVEENIPLNSFQDEHRVLVGPNDRMRNKEQIKLLDTLGYMGDYSFESFSPVIQKMGAEELEEALNASLNFILN